MRHSVAVWIFVSFIVQLGFTQWICDHSPLVDGCSFPLFPKIFQTVCNRHDICYKCGASRGITKEQCDVAFQRDINMVCQIKGSSCSLFASMAYGGLKLFAGIYYRTVVPNLCFAPWVNLCFPAIN